MQAAAAHPVNLTNQNQAGSNTRPHAANDEAGYNSDDLDYCGSANRSPKGGMGAAAEGEYEPAEEVFKVMKKKPVGIHLGRFESFDEEAFKDYKVVPVYTEEEKLA